VTLKPTPSDFKVAAQETLNTVSLAFRINSYLKGEVLDELS